jgi:hypothetical protein
MVLSYLPKNGIKGISQAPNTAWWKLNKRAGIRKGHATRRSECAPSTNKKASIPAQHAKHGETKQTRWHPQMPRHASLRVCYFYKQKRLPKGSLNCLLNCRALDRMAQHMQNKYQRDQQQHAAQEVSGHLPPI